MVHEQWGGGRILKQVSYALMEDTLMEDRDGSWAMGGGQGVHLYSAWEICRKYE